MPTALGEPTPTEIAHEFTAKANDVLAALADIHPTLLWVPGNHDPDEFFDPAHAGFSGAFGTNIHSRVERLAPDLWIAGWGGCVEATESGQTVWGAYPYAEAELPARIEALRAELATKVPPGSTVILVTHAGPSASSTVLVSGTDPNSLLVPGVRGVGDAEAASGRGAAKDEENGNEPRRAVSRWIQTGSDALSELIFESAQQESVIFQVHGHTHNGCGISRVGAVPVINPGSLRFTSTYAVVQLKKERAGGWALTSTDIRRLG